jgi:hypothetical protein
VKTEPGNFPSFTPSNASNMAVRYPTASLVHHIRSMGPQKVRGYGSKCFRPRRVALNFACSRSCHSRRFCLKPGSFENDVPGVLTAYENGEGKTIRYTNPSYGRSAPRPYAHGTGGHSRNAVPGATIATGHWRSSLAPGTVRAVSDGWEPEVMARTHRVPTIRRRRGTQSG